MGQDHDGDCHVATLHAMTIYLKPRFADNLFDFGVEETVGIGRLQDDSGVHAAAGAADGNNLLVDAEVTGVRGHRGNLAGDFHALAEGAVSHSDNITDII
jgi:hypothetical protein